MNALYWEQVSGGSQEGGGVVVWMAAGDGRAGRDGGGIAWIDWGRTRRNERNAAKWRDREMDVRGDSGDMRNEEKEGVGWEIQRGMEGEGDED
ncbi:hypothetical protein E2C01_096155 [Portunus trituberculatus]|uniref:Uncharacterized protein n=1 Tax=Portunus trituberculatus TaxID=210409 RepID=A0A5B7K2B1_PORTR|nr:hypothetical protein [Portunus trituberculatus]